MSVAERNLTLGSDIGGTRDTDPRLQSFACLIAVTIDWEIIHVSANIGDFLDLDSSILGHTLDQVLLDDAVHEIRGVLNATAGHGGVGRLLGSNLRHGYPQFDLTIHENAHGFIIEIERGEPLSKIDDIGLVRGLMARIKQSATKDEAAEKAARSIRALTGFDRVTVCQVRKDGAAEVISEASMPGIASLTEAGLTAQDVSAIGLDRHQQLVADVDAAPVAVMSRPSSAPLDLHLAISLAPTAACRGLLRAHGAKAALTIPILCKNKVAGLILCHHTKPLRAGFRMRMLVDLFVDLYAYEFAET